MWSGLGVNYKSSQANWAADAAYFKQVGLRIIRPSLSSFPNSPYTAGSNAGLVGSIEWWRQCADYFQGQGFQIVYGIARVTGVSGTFDATAWATYRANVLADAAYNQSIGFAPEFYQIGNEIEGIINNTTYTQTQLISDLKTLATDLQPYLSENTRLVYSTYDLSSTMFNNWISAGLGDIDVLGGNVYAQTGANGRNFIFGDMSRLGLMIKTFGADRFILTEFGITGNSAEYAVTPEYNRNYAMRHIYAGIKELGFTTAIVYSYVGYLDGDNDFALKNTNGTFDIQWRILLADNGPIGVTSTGLPVNDLKTAAATRPVATLPRTAKPSTPVLTFLDANGNVQDNRLTPVNQEALRFGLTGDFTFVTKINPHRKTVQGNSSAHTLCRMDFSFGNDKGYLIQMNATNGSFRIWSGATAQDTATGLFTYETVQWIAVTISGTVAKFYVNGTQVGSNLTIIRKADNATNNIWFYTESGGAGASVNGLFAEAFEVMSKKALLTELELAEIVQGIYPAVDIRYKFTRGAGRWVADLSGNNNHGLLSIERWGRRQ